MAYHFSLSLPSIALLVGFRGLAASCNYLRNRALRRFGGTPPTPTVDPLTPFRRDDPHHVAKVAPHSDPSFLDCDESEVLGLTDRVPHAGLANARFSRDGANAELAIAGSADFFSDNGKCGLF